MLKIDNTLLQDIGLGQLPEAEKNSLLKHIYETLEMRVGMRLADQMSNEQLDEFERYFEAKDDAGAFKWLESNFPNYKDIVQEEFDKLKSEVAQTAPQILGASQAQAGQPQATPAVDPYSGQQPQPVQPQQQYAPQPPQPSYPPHAPAYPEQPGYQPQAAPAQPYAAPPTPAPQPQQPWTPPMQPDPTQQPPQYPSDPSQQQPPAYQPPAGQ